MGDVERQSGIGKFVVFLDENHCHNPHLIAALATAGIECQKHLDHFSRGLEDTAWIPEIAKHGWCLLTADARIRYNELERRAVKENAIRMFYFSSNNLAGVGMGTALLKALPKMQKLFNEQMPPFAASITKLGEVNLRTTFD